MRVHRDARRDLRRTRERATGVVLVRDVRPVRAGRLALEAGLVREHPPDRETLDRAERALRRLELGEIGDRGIVERELPSSRSCMIAVAVKVFVIEAMR